MKHRNSHFAVGYWSRIRYGRVTPDQADIDPKALRRLLPFVFLLDARGGSFTYRLAGTTLCERYGSELRGRDYLFHWDPDSRARLSPLLQRSLKTGLPVCLTSIGADDNCHMTEIETVLMPITFGGDNPERFLGVAQIVTDVATLAGRAITFERLVTASLVKEEDSAAAPPPAPPSHDGWQSHPKAPHLRLVVSRKPVHAAEDPLGIGSEDPLNAVIGSLARLGTQDIQRF